MTHKLQEIQMLTMDKARTRVARGAAHLDQVRPGWVHRVDVGTLTLSSCYRCVLGQLTGSFWKGLTLVHALLPGSGSDWSIQHRAVKEGFVLRNAENDAAGHGYQVLQDAWIEAICDRRVQHAASPASPVEQCV